MSHRRRIAQALVLGCGLVGAACDGETSPPHSAPALVAAPGDDRGATLEARRKALAAELRDLVAELERAGEYECCTATACTWCAVHTGGCRCGEGLRGGDPVCEECALMWEKGRGAEDVDPSTVRSFTEEARLRSGKICGGDPARRTAPYPAPAASTAPPPTPAASTAPPPG